jgi:hypothetical protein
MTILTPEQPKDRSTSSAFISSPLTALAKDMLAAADEDEQEDGQQQDTAEADGDADAVLRLDDDDEEEDLGFSFDNVYVADTTPSPAPPAHPASVTTGSTVAASMRPVSPAQALLSSNRSAPSSASSSPLTKPPLNRPLAGRLATGVSPLATHSTTVTPAAVMMSLESKDAAAVTSANTAAAGLLALHGAGGFAADVNPMHRVRTNSNASLSSLASLSTPPHPPVVDSSQQTSSTAVETGGANTFQAILSASSSHDSLASLAKKGEEEKAEVETSQSTASSKPAMGEEQALRAQEESLVSTTTSMLAIQQAMKRPSILDYSPTTAPVAVERLVEAAEPATTTAPAATATAAGDRPLSVK